MISNVHDQHNESQGNRAYQVCSACVMDTSASDIRFDHAGVCNYCTEFRKRVGSRANTGKAKAALSRLVRNITADGRGREYDCIVGLSGGLDSCYTLYITKELGLRPLAVHLDNGWNSDVAVRNIRKLITHLNVDLYTHVIEWDEYRDLQLAFLRANVVDVEMITDHAIRATLFKAASRHGLKYILAGINRFSEGMGMPPGWNHPKLDLCNIDAIYKRWGRGRALTTFPSMGIAKYIYYSLARGIHRVPLLDYIAYNTREATQTLQEQAGYRPYSKKHYESVFTRFYQAYILPRKFGVDKRRVHYSTLICSGLLSRAEAHALLEKGTYDNDRALEEDRQYVVKKLGLTDEEFERYMRSDAVSHLRYPSRAWALIALRKLRSRVSGIKGYTP